MKKFIVFVLAMSGMTQADRHMNGFDDHHGDHVVHESRIDPIDVGHRRTVPDYVGHEDRIDGHRSSEHHDPMHSKILPQDILEHPLGGSKYESVHDAVKHDKGVEPHHGHGHGHGEGHDGGHDLHSNEFFGHHGGDHGDHGHGHGDDDDDDDHHGDHNLFDHRIVHHDNTHDEEHDH